MGSLSAGMHAAYVDRAMTAEEEHAKVEEMKQCINSDSASPRYIPLRSLDPTELANKIKCYME